MSSAVLDATEAVFVAFDAWQAWPGWRDDDIGRQLQHLIETARTAMAVLPDRPDPAAVAAAVTPLLRVW